MFRKGLQFLGESARARALLTTNPVTRSAHRRFVAGESIDDFIRVAAEATGQGFAVIANHLGEEVSDALQAHRASTAYMELVDRLRDEPGEINVSLKLSQLGIDLPGDHLRRNLDPVLDRATASGVFIRFDMESSRYTQDTLDLIESLWSQGRRQIGAVLQACLVRSRADLGRMIELGVPIRLCKGAYAEPETIAYQSPRKVRAHFRELMAMLLLEGAEPAIATHDERLIRDAIAISRNAGISPDRFEFQLLHGVRRDLQRELRDQGYRVRVYIPFGENWYPYLVRRLAERPENLFFMVGSILKESPLGALLPGRRGVREN